MIKFLKNKSLIKVISASLFSTVVLVMLGAFLLIALDPSYGWFADNREVIADGMQVSVDSDDYIYIKEVNVYKYNEDKTEVLVETGSIADLELTAYDSVITDRNKQLGIIVKIDILASNTGTINLVLTCTSSEIDTYISDIIYVKVLAIDVSSANYYEEVDSGDVVEVEEDGATVYRYQSEDGEEVFLTDGTNTYKDMQGNTIGSGKYVKLAINSRELYNIVNTAAESVDENTGEEVYPKFNFVTINGDTKTKSQELVASVDITQTECTLFFYMNYDPVLLADVSISADSLNNTQEYEGDLERLYFTFQIE